MNFLPFVAYVVIASTILFLLVKMLKEEIAEEAQRQVNWGRNEKI